MQKQEQIAISPVDDLQWQMADVDYMGEVSWSEDNSRISYSEKGLMEAWNAFLSDLRGKKSYA